VEASIHIFLYSAVHQCDYPRHDVSNLQLQKQKKARYVLNLRLDSSQKRRGCRRLQKCSRLFLESNSCYIFNYSRNNICSSQGTPASIVWGTEKLHVFCTW